jgi:DNA-binding XRE family transcriptional regulator
MAKVIDSPLTREITRRGIRRNWMAERLGVRPWTFSRIEAGKQPAPADWYPRAAEILGVAVAVITPEESEVAA